MSWLTETLDKISKSYAGLNTSAMQGAGSMGLLNIERASEKMNPEEAKEFKLKAKANLVTGTMLAPAVPFLVNGLVTAPVTTALELAGGTATGIGATVAADKAIEYGSDGKYTGFTDYVTKKFPNSNPYIVEQFHPAGWIGGFFGGWGTRNAFIRTPRGKVELVSSELAKDISNTKLDKSFPNTSYNQNNILYYQPKEVTYTPKTNSEKTYLRLLEKPSKLTEAERLGVSNSLRNNKILIKDSDDRTKILRKYVNEKGEIPEDVQSIPFTEEEIANAIPEVAENMKYSNRSYLANKNKKYFNAIPNEDNDLVISNIKSYLNQFSDVEINPNFLKKDGNQSHYIAMYRNYMNNMGYDTSNLSNEEIAKLLTLQYNNLTANQTGLMKGQLLWHSSPKMFDKFDWKAHVGENFGNMGAAGPANYFSLIGGTRYGQAKNLFGEFITINDQPYLLNNISSTPSRNVLVKKGIKPEYTSPLHSEELNAYKARVIDPALAKTKEGNMLVIDDFMIPVKGIMDNSSQVEFALTRNSGIKSLYPHPSLFVKNPDGTITVTRNWNDLKVNYKQGGSIHIKEKNKGKFTESAKRAGKSVQEHARDVVNNPKATKLQKKRALFALNSKKFKH